MLAIRNLDVSFGRGEDAVRVMRSIKAALDPQGLLNPGKVL